MHDSNELCDVGDFDSFSELVDEIKALGYDEKTASHYAALIGDTPIADEDGNIVVMDGEKVLATLKPLKFFCG